MIEGRVLRRAADSARVPAPRRDTAGRRKGPASPELRVAVVPAAGAVAGGPAKLEEGRVTDLIVAVVTPAEELSIGQNSARVEPACSSRGFKFTRPCSHNLRKQGNCWEKQAQRTCAHISPSIIEIPTKLRRCTLKRWSSEGGDYIRLPVCGFPPAQQNARSICGFRVVHTISAS